MKLAACPVLALLLTGTLCLTAHGHGANHHAQPVQAEAVPARPDAATTINESYKATIRPIFKKACFDCHAEPAAYPWYYRIPGVKQLIDRDINEARKHLDMRADFPFTGHATQDENLKAIAEDMQKGEMPPFFYLLMHKEATLTEAERSAIINWANESRALLLKK